MSRKKVVANLLAVSLSLLLSGAAAGQSAEPQVLDKDPIHVSKFNQLSPVAQKIYEELPWPAKQMLVKKFQEQTTVIPGILSIGHKQAFIEGKVVGKDVFNLMNGQIDKMIADGEIKADWGPVVHKFFETARTLTPQQRAAWIDLLERDVQLAGSR